MKTALVTALLCAPAVIAQATAQTPPQIPIRQLAPVVAKTSIAIAALGGLQQMPDGRLLVNDTRGLRLLVFDSSLAKFTAVADTTAKVGHYTGRAGSPLIPYVGDSTLFVDVDSRSLVLIEPSGRMGRVMSPPTARDGINMPGAGADAKGRLVYRAVPQLRLVPNTDGRGGVSPAPPPDSAFIVRADFETRQLDTLGSVRVVTPSRPVTTYDASGRRSMRQTVNPVPPAIDEGPC